MIARPTRHESLRLPGQRPGRAGRSTFTVKIEARNPDPEVAKLMALTLADEFVEERTHYYAQQDKSDRIEVKIRSRAIGA